jgi:phytoene dehydrogenase-like protein
MAEKSVIIIGAGIAGLSAGCYAQMNGFKSEIYEMHNIPGGLCTAWKRKGYIFDGCIHWLTGSSPKSPLYQFWEEIGMTQGKQFIKYEYYTQSIDEQGNRFIAYTNPDKLEEHMLNISKEDEKLIKGITKAMRTLMDKNIPMDHPSIVDYIKMIPFLRIYYKYSMPISEFVKKIKNPVLANLFNNALNWHDMPAFVPIWTLSLMGSGDGGYPIGGSIPLAKSVEDRYINLGGKISYNSKITKILVENDKAVGVMLSDGSERRGDIIISGADGHSTIFDWLEGKYVDEKIKGYYDNLEPFPPLVYVSLGVNDDFSDEPHSLTFPLKNPIKIGNKELQKLTINNYCFDKTLAPQGKSVLIAMIEADYDYWVPLKDNKVQYLEEKQNIEDAVVGALSELYPDIKSKIEVVDVATPLTFERYTGNWRGSYEGWLFSKKAMKIRMSQTLPGLSNFYMVGQWVSPGGGLPSGIITARNAFKQICKKEGKEFITTKP